MMSGKIWLIKGKYSWKKQGVCQGCEVEGIEVGIVEGKEEQGRLVLVVEVVVVMELNLVLLLVEKEETKMVVGWVEVGMGWE